MVTDKKIKLRSRINKFFTPELQRELEQMIFYEYGRDNNAKAKEVFNIIRRVNPAANAAAIGPGTNRYAVLIDGYVFKIALDKDGVIDNMKEFSLSKVLYLAAIKVYEMSLNGMIISCEPGLYFENLGIGVRIEDDILVTEEGNENLSKDIIKEIDDIENFMAQFK